MAKEFEMTDFGENIPQANPLRGVWAHKAVILNEGKNGFPLVYGVGTSKKEAIAAAKKRMPKGEYFWMNVTGDLKTIDLQRGATYKVWGSGGHEVNHGTTDGLSH